MKRRSIFKVDLTKIDGEGEFPCPSCGEIISPDDDSGLPYDIVEVNAKEDSLESLTIICNQCKSVIHIVGFEELNALV